MRLLAKIGFDFKTVQNKCSRVHSGENLSKIGSERVALGSHNDNNLHTAQSFTKPLLELWGCLNGYIRYNLTLIRSKFNKHSH